MMSRTGLKPQFERNDEELRQPIVLGSPSLDKQTTSCWIQGLRLGKECFGCQTYFGGCLARYYRSFRKSRLPDTRLSLFLLQYIDTAAGPGSAQTGKSRTGCEWTDLTLARFCHLVPTKFSLVRCEVANRLMLAAHTRQREVATRNPSWLQQHT